MRLLMATLIVACATAAPLLSQIENNDEPVSFAQRESKACGPKAKEVKYAADTDKTKHPTGEQAADRALIYILRSSFYGPLIQTKLAVDGEWKGVNRAHNYFFFTVQPGLHYFCSEAENRSVLVLTAEAGKTYYIEQEVRYFPIKPRTELAILDDAAGRSELAEAHPSTWKVKP
jgi:hypothetical protein